MASSIKYYTPQFTCKEGFLHIFINDRWKKKLIVLNGSSLVIYKKKSKESVPKSVFDLTKAIAISSPLAVEPECPFLPPKIPYFRGFSIRFNETANKKIFAAFAFSHQDCLQWVQSVRFNTNSTQLFSKSFPVKSTGFDHHELIENEPNDTRTSISNSISSIHSSKNSENLAEPNLTLQYYTNFPNETDIDNFNQSNFQPIDIESSNYEADIYKTKCIQLRSCSMSDISERRIDCELFVESNNETIPLPPPYNPSYD